MAFLAQSYYKRDVWTRGCDSTGLAKGARVGANALEAQGLEALHTLPSPLFQRASESAPQ